MKILHVVPGLNEGGNGIAVAAKLIAEGQSKSGDEVEVVDTREFASSTVQPSTSNLQPLSAYAEIWVHSMWLPVTLKACWKVLRLKRANLHSTTTTSNYDSLSWIAGNMVRIDEGGRIISCVRGNGWHDWLYHHAVPHVYGPSAFFRRELFERVGGFDTSLDVCMDWDLWIRFMKAGARFRRIGDYCWGLRQWTQSKTQRTLDATTARRHADEVSRMLAKNELVPTVMGTLTNRIWRLLDGALVRSWMDTLRLRGRMV